MTCFVGCVLCLGYVFRDRRVGDWIAGDVYAVLFAAAIGIGDLFFSHSCMLAANTPKTSHSQQETSPQNNRKPQKNKENKTLLANPTETGHPQRLSSLCPQRDSNPH